MVVLSAASCKAYDLMVEPVPPLSRFLRACNLGGAAEQRKIRLGSINCRLLFEGDVYRWIIKFKLVIRLLNFLSNTGVGID